MNVHPKVIRKQTRPAAGIPGAHGKRERPPFECIPLVLQGGGALGAYQAGVCEALAEVVLCDLADAEVAAVRWERSPSPASGVCCA